MFNTAEEVLDGMAIVEALQEIRYRKATLREQEQCVVALKRIARDTGLRMECDRIVRAYMESTRTL